MTNAEKKNYKIIEHIAKGFGAIATQSVDPKYMSETLNDQIQSLESVIESLEREIADLCRRLNAQAGNEFPADFNVDVNVKNKERADVKIKKKYAVRRDINDDLIQRFEVENVVPLCRDSHNYFVGNVLQTIKEMNETATFVAHKLYERRNQE